MIQCSLFEMPPDPAPPVDLEMCSVDPLRNRDRVWRLTRKGRCGVIVQWGRRGQMHAPKPRTFTTSDRRAKFEREMIRRRIAHGYVTVLSRLEEWPAVDGAHARG